MDVGKTQTRERLWVEKFDHTKDPPELVETVFVENGRVVAVTRPGEEKGGADEGPAGGGE